MHPTEANRDDLLQAIAKDASQLNDIQRLRAAIATVDHAIATTRALVSNSK